MGKIKQLSKEVINQIAAGEIVQRNGHHNLLLNSYYLNLNPFGCLKACLKMQC